MSKVLMTWNGNYADEFDLSGWIVTEKEDANKYIEFLNCHEDEISWYFGTNEEMQYSNGAELAQEFDIKDITDAQADVLDDLFGGSFGETTAFDQDCLDDDDYSDEEYLWVKSGEGREDH